MSDIVQEYAGRVHRGMWDALEDYTRTVGIEHVRSITYSQTMQGFNEMTLIGFEGEPLAHVWIDWDMDKLIMRVQGNLLQWGA